MLKIGIVGAESTHAAGIAKLGIAGDNTGHFVLNSIFGGSSDR